MRHMKHALVAAAAIGIAALTVSAAEAQYWSRFYGPRYFGPSYYGAGLDATYYSYGANRANPSIAPYGLDMDNPRDQQLQGHN
jgi:hypothetical protein